MKRLFLTIVMVLSMINLAYGAGTCSQKHANHGGFQIITMTWTTDGAGAFTGTQILWPINGMVIQVETDPSATAAPTAAYDLTLTDSGSADIMSSVLADRSATATEIVKPALGSVAVQGYLTLNVSNAGNSTSGVVKIYYYSSN